MNGIIYEAWFAVQRSLILSPLVYADVALVHLICAIPCGMLFLSLVPRFAGLLVGVSSGILLGLFLYCSARPAFVAPAISLLPQLEVIVFRSWLGILCGLFTASLFHAESRVKSMTLKQRLGWGLVAAWILVALPATYVTARCRNDLRKMGELVGQTRLAEALSLGIKTLRLSPGIRFRDQNLSLSVAQLQDRVGQVEKLVAEFDVGTIREDEWLLQAQRQAILGSTDAALQTVTEHPRQLPTSWNLTGMIYESRCEWQLGYADYARGFQEWSHEQNSGARQQGQVRSLTGMAFCARKLSWVRLAENHYLERLNMDPSAESHFLLAQFYEDIQQTTDAKFHVEQAIALAPQRYGPAGRDLIRKLQTVHLGCLSAGMDYSLLSRSRSR